MILHLFEENISLYHLVTFIPYRKLFMNIGFLKIKKFIARCKNVFKKMSTINKKQTDQFFQHFLTSLKVNEIYVLSKEFYQDIFFSLFEKTIGNDFHFHY